MFVDIYGLPCANSACTVGPAAVRMALETPVEFVNKHLGSNLVVFTVNKYLLWQKYVEHTRVLREDIEVCGVDNGIGGLICDVTLDHLKFDSTDRGSNLIITPGNMAVKGS